MRFESLLWSALALFLMGGAGFDDSLAGGASGSGEYQAADGGTPVPPPLMDPGDKIPPSSLDGGTPVPPPTGP